MALGPRTPRKTLSPVGENEIERVWRNELRETDCQDHTPSIAFRYPPPKEGCRKPVLGVCVRTTLRASLSGTLFQRKDVVNQCLEFVLCQDRTPSSFSGTLLQRKDVVNQCLEFVSGPHSEHRFPAPSSKGRMS